MAVIFQYLLIFILMLFHNSVLAKPYSSTLCNKQLEDTPFYECQKIKRGDNWKKLFPDEQQRDLVMRLNRTNSSLRRGQIIAVPKNLHNLSVFDISPFPKFIEAPGDKVIYVSLKELAFAAYDEQGNLEYWGPISGGQNYCADVGRGCRTITGNFKVYRKGGAGCYSSKFPVGRGGAPMPYCMFFMGGYALHGSYDVPGYHASHGCVRMFVKDAKWLNENFIMDRRNIPIIIRAEEIN